MVLKAYKYNESYKNFHTLDYFFIEYVLSKSDFWERCICSEIYESHRLKFDTILSFAEVIQNDKKQNIASNWSNLIKILIKDIDFRSVLLTDCLPIYVENLVTNQKKLHNIVNLYNEISFFSNKDKSSDARFSLMEKNLQSFSAICHLINLSCLKFYLEKYEKICQIDARFCENNPFLNKMKNIFRQRTDDLTSLEKNLANSADLTKLVTMATEELELFESIKPCLSFSLDERKKRIIEMENKIPQCNNEYEPQKKGSGDKSFIRKDSGKYTETQSKDIQTGNKCAFDCFMDDFHEISEITQKTDVKALALLASKGDIGARNLLVEGFLRIVLKIVTTETLDGEIPDMIQEGCIGLMEAAEKFDCERDTNFHSYGYYWARQRITRSKGETRLIRLPVHVIETLERYKKNYLELSRENYREPTVAEVVERMQLKEQSANEAKSISSETSENEFFISHQSFENEIMYSSELSCERIENLIQWTQNHLSLEALAEDGIDISNCITDESNMPEYIAYSTALTNSIKSVLKHLSEREKQVLTLRFGLEDGHNRTLEEIGSFYGVTRERIRQIEAKALRKLRLPKISKRLSEFWL